MSVYSSKSSIFIFVFVFFCLTDQTKININGFDKAKSVFFKGCHVALQRHKINGRTASH